MEGYSPQHRAPSRAGPSPDARCPELPGCHVPCWRPSPGFCLLSVLSAAAPAPSHRLLLTKRPKQAFRCRSAVPVLCSDPLSCPRSLGGVAWPGSPQGSGRPTALRWLPLPGLLTSGAAALSSQLPPHQDWRGRPAPHPFQVLAALPGSGHALPERPAHSRPSSGHALPRAPPCFLRNADQPLVNRLPPLFREKAGPLRTGAVSRSSMSLSIRAVPGTQLAPR